ncbi:GEL complex subunit OPTI-like [Ptychodera flava]|uniref:GEL complex subunit OPTI-like n=1 Tax=Ptychodera flava TaxID=63121 RepID=UPI003969BD83
MSTARRRKGEANTSLGTAPSVWQRAFSSKSEWNDKDEFLDVVYWMKQILSILVGAIWGFIPLTGIIGIGLFGAVNTVVTYIYTMTFQKIDEDEYGGIWEIIKEGFMSSFAMFLVAWIFVYSALHFD